MKFVFDTDFHSDDLYSSAWFYDIILMFARRFPHYRHRVAMLRANHTYCREYYISSRWCIELARELIVGELRVDGVALDWGKVVRPCRQS